MIDNIVIQIPEEEIPVQESISISIPEKPKEEEKTTIVITVPKENIDVIPTIPLQIISNPNTYCKDCESITDKADTGFGPEQTLTIPECPTPKHYTHLYKENYLSEFKTETEKELARNNLGVYSKEYINNVINNIVINNKNFVTKSEVEVMIQDLDFVTSKLKSYADYQIPNNLFTL